MPASYTMSDLPWIVAAAAPLPHPVDWWQHIKDNTASSDLKEICDDMMSSWDGYESIPIATARLANAVQELKAIEQTIRVDRIETNERGGGVEVHVEATTVAV